MYSKRGIIRLVDEAEVKFLQCWEGLCLLKNGFKNGAEDIICLLDFQPTLCEALMSLEKDYRNIRHERTALIKREKFVTKLWYNRRRSKLERYSKIIAETIAFGKTLGDAFAWFFYQKDRKLLAEHQAQQRMLHLPVGLGARGELEFIKGVRKLGDYLILYHGTTTLLRLGDVSLIDLQKFKIVGIGELKTRRTSDQEIQIQIKILSKKDFTMPILPVKDEAAFVLPPEFEERLNRQVKRIAESLKTSQQQAEFHISSTSNMHIKELKEVLRNTEKRSAAWKKAGDGLVILGIRMNFKKLSEFLFLDNISALSKKIRGSEAEVMKTVDSSAGEKNSISIGTFYSSDPEKELNLEGLVPIFWWPLSISELERLMFHKTHVMTAYNSVHLRRKFEVLGFEVKVGENKVDFEITTTKDGKFIKFQGVSYYLKLITNYLFNEEAIVNIIQKSLDHCLHQKFPDDRTCIIKLNLEHIIE